jgi:putative MATE family efflux protein
MGRDRITRLLLRFSGPAILAAETSALYNLFDAIWCGRLQTEAVAALAVANPLMAIYRAIGAGIGVGATSLIARNLGAGKKDETNRTAGCGISLFFIVSGLVTIISLMNLEPLLRLFGANDSVMPFAYSYMFVETYSLVLDFFLVILVELVRVGGSPAWASAGMITASVMDLIWSPILVFGVGPLPALGIAGAALGTTVGRGVGVSILLVYLGLGKSIYQFKPRHFLPNLGIVTEIYRVGLSQTVRASSASLSLAIANNVAASFGVVALAVLGVIFKVNMLVFAFCMGIGQGMLPLVGYNFGAQKKERVSEVVVKAGLTSFTWGALCWVVVTLFPAQIMSVFGTNPDFLAAGTAALRIFALGFFAVGVQNNLSFFFQGIGRGIPSLVVASSRNIIFLVPCLLTLPRLFGLTGLWVAYPVADALSLVLTLTWMVATFRSLKIPLRLRSGSPTA